MITREELRHRRALIVQCIERRLLDKAEREAEIVAEQREEVYRDRLGSEGSDA